MPIARKYKSTCSKCAYTEICRLGDVRPDMNMLKPCSKCGRKMVMKEMEDLLFSA